MLCAQLKAFLECQNAAGDIVMLDHLGLSDNALPTGALASLVQSACLLRPWWRLRSLAVARCGLALEGFLALATPEAGPAVKHLARLDLSGNGAVGRAPSGQLVSAEELLASGHLLLMHLWRNAPLRFVDLTGTDLSSSALAGCLRMLRTYLLPSSVPGPAAYLHDGTRPELQCLRVGPPGEGGHFSGDALTEVGLLAQAAPNLRVLEVRGVGPQHRAPLEEAWETAQTSRGLKHCVAEVQPGLLRLAAGSAVHQRLPIEAPPAHHTPPGPEDSPQHGKQRTLLDDLTADSAHAGSHPHHHQGFGLYMATPALNPGGASGRERNAHPMLPPRRPNPQGAGRQRGRGDGGGRAASRHGGFPRNPHPAGAPRRKRKSPGHAADHEERPVRMYRGGAGDELPERGIDLQDEDRRDLDEYDEEDEEYDLEGSDIGGAFSDMGGTGSDIGSGTGSDSEDDDEGGQGGGEGEVLPTNPPGQGTGNTQHLHGNTGVVKDGRMDGDTRRGRAFRKELAQLLNKIPETERKRAKLAFKNWSSLGTNPWDPKRWWNPSFDQHDDPGLLQGLHLMFDLLQKHHGKDLRSFFHNFPPPAAPVHEEVRPPVRLPVRLPVADAAARRRRPAAGNAEQQGRRGMQVAGRFVADGGHGRGSDDEFEGDNEEADGFIASDGDDSDEGPSDGDGDSGPDAVGAAATHQAQPVEAMPGMPARMRAVVESSDDDDAATDGGAAHASAGDPSPMEVAVEQQPGEAAQEEAVRWQAGRQAKEMAQLAPWGWDSRLGDHPPNEKEYGGPSSWKRRSVLPGHYLQETQEEEEEEEKEEWEEPPAVSPPTAPPSPDHCSDDEPLVCLRRPTSAPKQVPWEPPGLQGNAGPSAAVTPAAPAALDIFPDGIAPEAAAAAATTPAPAAPPPSSAPPSGPPSAAQVAAWADCMLGDLYMSAPMHRPPPALLACPHHQTESEAHMQRLIIPDSQEEEGGEEEEEGGEGNIACAQPQPESIAHMQRLIIPDSQEEEGMA